MAQNQGELGSPCPWSLSKIRVMGYTFEAKMKRIAVKGDDNMAYTFSFDISLKLRGCDIKGFLNHFLREADEPKKHSNQDINPAKAHNNMTLVYNAGIGKMMPTNDRREIMDAINNRLSDAIDLKKDTYRTTGKKVRSDAVKCRGIVVQIDPQFYRENKENPKTIMKSYNDMLHLIQKQYGKENIIAASVHLDETNPHIHLLMTPVTDDGRLSQKDFIDKKKLLAAHKEMREELRSKGYDIDLERRTPKNAKRLNEQDYKVLKDSEKKLKELNDLEISLKQRKRKLDDEENQFVSEKGEFEIYRTSENHRLETENQHIRQLEQQAASKLNEADELYAKSRDLHLKLMDMSDIFLEKYADNFAKELGYTKMKISKGLSR